MPAEWRAVRIGGGGWLVGLDIGADGTRVVRADVYGAYHWTGTSWTQRVNTTSMPAADVDLNNGFGVYEIRIAPNNYYRMYMMYNGFIYRTDNCGLSWMKQNMPRAADSDANGPYRTYGRKIAVDPRASLVAMFSTPGGVFLTTNGGWSATALTALGTASGPGFAVAFDPSSPALNGRTSVLYVARYGVGVYRSADGGASWTLLVGGPTTFGHMVVGQDGTVYVTPYNRTNTLYIFRSGGWSVKTVATDPNNFTFAVAVDPANPQRIVVAANNGSLSLSSDGGATWSGYKGWKAVATDIPWLAPASVGYLAVGDIAFDPTKSNTLYLSAGVGVWKTNPSNAIPTWTSETTGIEELVANVVIAPPSGKPLFASWDRPVMRSVDPEVFPVTQPTNTATAIIHGWALDYAPATPSFVAGIFNDRGDDRSGFSNDGGITWQQFASKPAHVINTNARIGGCIAVGSPNNILWFPSYNSPGYYTLNGGATWLETIMPGVSNDPATETGWGYLPYFKRFTVTADRVTAGVFYAYNYLKGLYRSVNGGASWSLIYSGEIFVGSKYNAKLRAMPGIAGLLFFTTGNTSVEKLASPNANPLRVSIDGGTTWSDVPGVFDVFDIGFGAPAPGTTLATIFVIGYVNGVFGYYRSTDRGSTWVSLGQFPKNLIDNPQCINGDMNIFGRIYVGFGGSGFVYRDS